MLWFCGKCGAQHGESEVNAIAYTPRQHRPVSVDIDRYYIVCMCGWTSKDDHPSLDSAWDEYDEHTME